MMTVVKTWLGRKKHSTIPAKQLKQMVSRELVSVSLHLPTSGIREIPMGAE